LAYDELLADRVRDALAAESDVREQKMFGGLAFMVRGHMCVGLLADELMVRVGPDGYDDALRRAGVREMDFTGRPMRGIVMVAPSALRGRAVRAWVERGLEFVATLPPRAVKPRAVRRRPRSPGRGRPGDAHGTTRPR
jgi:TfoX/Sxy family transcriptional regulator of competence genes